MLPAVPFRGIRAFRYADHAIFFAREEETRRLASLVAVYRGVMLYGDSGDGKSSLINAGLIPDVIELGFRPERLRVQPRAGEEIVIERIATADEGSELLPSSLVPDDDEAPRVVLSTEAFEERVRETCASHRPLLVFDQFEEILTLFEEAGAYEAQQRIVAMLVRLLREPLAVKVLLAFREDYLGKVKQLLGACPELVDQALRLGPPAADALPTIIRGPFERHPGNYEREFEPELVERLRAALAQRFGSGDLSLSEVQTVCLRLWRADDPQALLARRGVQGLLEDYLGEALDAFPPDLRGAAVALLAQMVTSAGTRNVISAEDVVARVRAEEDIPAPLLTRALDRLEQESRLVRRERRRELYLYEITSEFLVPWISERRQELRRAQERARERRRLRLVGFVVAALAVVAAVVAAIAVWALAQRRDAQARADEATSLALMEPAAGQRSLRPDVSLLLALAAYRASPRVEARNAIVSALATAEGGGGVAGILHGHSDHVEAVSFSPDGRTLASAGDDQTVRLWDARTHRQLGQTLSGSTGPVLDVAFSPDGRTLASANTDHSIRLADVRTREQVGSLLGHTGPVESVAFSPDGRTLASGSDDDTIRLWDVSSRRPLAKLAGHTATVRSVAFSRDGRILASGSDDNTIRLWDVRTRRLIASPLDAGDAVLSVALSPDGHTLASGGDDGRVRLWDVRDDKRIGAANKLDNSIESVAFSPDGRYLASGSDDNSVRVWDVRTHAQIYDLEGHGDSVLGVAFSPDGRTIASASVDDTIRLWQQVRPSPLALITTPMSAVRSLAVSGDGHTLAAGGDNSKAIGLWDTRTRQESGPPLIGHSDTVLGVAFSPDGSLASAGYDNTARLWDVSSHQQIGSPLEGHDDSVYGVAFSPDGRMLATGSHDNTVRLWDVSAHKQSGGPLTHPDSVESVAFSSDGDTVASAGDDATVRLWDVATHKPIAALKGHKGIVWAVAFDPARRDLLASVGNDWTVRLWSARTHRQLADSPLRGHTAPVYAVAFSRDGSLMATGGEDATIRIWDLRGPPHLLVTLPDDGVSVHSLAFSRDGATLAVGRDDSDIWLWDRVAWGGFGALRAQACRLVGQDLDRAEWRQYAADVSYRKSGCG